MEPREKVYEGNGKVKMERMNQNDLAKGYSIRDGYVFTAFDRSNIHDAIVIRKPETADSWTPKLGMSSRTVSEHIDYVNGNKIVKAVIIAEDISFICQCPSLKCLRIIPSDTSGDGFDFSPLYDIPSIKKLECHTTYGTCGMHKSTIDYSCIGEIDELVIPDGQGSINYNRIPSLRSLTIADASGKEGDLRDFFCSSHLEKLSLLQCRIRSLNGLERSSAIQSVELSYLRSLSDISALEYAMSTLTSLTIENCPKISDFSVLSSLYALEHLELYGGNTLPNLKFITGMGKLKTFAFSMDVADGDLTPCLTIPYTYSQKNRKHFNLKDSELSKMI